jgi:hypothetical protein
MDARWSPLRTAPITGLAHLDDFTSAWLHWYNISRLMHNTSGLMHLLGPRPPAGAEYYAGHGSGLQADGLRK